MIADPRWFAATAFNPGECVHESFVGRTALAITCKVIALTLEDGEAFLENSVFKLEQGGRALLQMPLKVIVGAGEGGYNLASPLKLTADTKVHIETPKGVSVAFPVVVVLGGKFL
jgi:hypothetical protein